MSAENRRKKLPPANSAHPLAGRLYSISAARTIILYRYRTERPKDVQDFILQCFGVRWIGDDDRDQVIARWIAET